MGRKKPPQRLSKTLKDRDKNRASKEKNKPLQQMQAKSQVGKIIKPMAKKWNKTRNTLNTLITHLISMLNEDWERDQISTFLTLCQSTKNPVSNNDGQDLLYILVATIHKANAKNPSNFSATSQLNVKEPETYKQTINRPHA